MGNNKIPGSLPAIGPTQKTPESDSLAPQSNPVDRSPSSASLDTLEYTSSEYTSAESSIPDTSSPLPPDPTTVAPTSRRAAIEKRYWLKNPARQKAGTKQCWWLSCLDCLRSQGKLGDAFETGLFKDAEVPESDGTLVYGPRWQRVIMKHLNNQPKHDPWHDPTTTCPASDRPEQLERLVRILGIEGVTIRPPMALTPAETQNHIRKLKNNQSVQVDKHNHAMSGVVRKIRWRVKGGKTITRTVIKVYNQATKNTFTVKVEGDGAETRLTGKEEGKGKTEINYIIPFHIEAP